MILLYVIYSYKYKSHANRPLSRKMFIKKIFPTQSLFIIKEKIYLQFYKYLYFYIGIYIYKILTFEKLENKNVKSVVSVAPLISKLLNRNLNINLLKLSIKITHMPLINHEM